MNLLFALDDRMTTPLLTTLYSIVRNSTATRYDIYVIQKKQLQETARITAFCAALGVHYHPLIIGDTVFSKAPITDRYPDIIYYRLLAQQYLPTTLERILYLDVDTLIINDLQPLYQLDLGTNLYAAASHTAITDNVRDSFNQLRLGNYEAESYYNSGVLLYNLPLIRQQVKPTAIKDYIAAKKLTLLLPDQDILNGLYGHQIKKIADERYNFDARRSAIYFALSNGVWDLDWVITHTVVLHFCGRDKPWKKDYHNRYAGLYKHYAHRTQLLLQSQP